MWTSKVLITGLSAIFLLIGIMNFINTMVVSVNTRKHEFAALESIGMTKKQIKSVLLFEGGYYWLISFLLLATLGTGIYIPIYSAFSKMAPYLIMLGNDDLLSVEGLFEQVCGEFENVHNIAGKKALIGEYEFIGMNNILDHPFGCKDRVVTEKDYIPQRQLSYFAGISNEYGYDRIFDWLEYSRTKLPLMCDILQELPEPENPKQTIYVMHMPPAGLRLGQLLYQDLDIGSVDIYEFLKSKQPLLSLHGHIHESPDTEKGMWINQIRHTVCIQPGQTELGSKDMIYAEIDLQKQEYARQIINV